jgi:hypothetical protein
MSVRLAIKKSVEDMVPEPTAAMESHKEGDKQGQHEEADASTGTSNTSASTSASTNTSTSVNVTSSTSVSGSDNRGDVSVEDAGTGSKSGSESDSESNGGQVVQYIDDEWIGEVIATKGQSQFYEAVSITIYSSDDEFVCEAVIRLGCCVELKTDEAVPYLVKVLELYEEDGEKFMNACYYYRQGDTAKKELKRLNTKLTEKDIFMSAHREVPNLLSCISRVCTVYHEPPTNSAQPSSASDEYEFVCRYFYAAHKKKLRPLTPNEVIAANEAMGKSQPAAKINESSQVDESSGGPSEISEPTPNATAKTSKASTVPRSATNSKKEKRKRNAESHKGTSA